MACCCFRSRVSASKSDMSGPVSMVALTDAGSSTLCPPLLRNEPPIMTSFALRYSGISLPISSMMTIFVRSVIFSDRLCTAIMVRCFSKDFKILLRRFGCLGTITNSSCRSSFNQRSTMFISSP